jgi:hypothetical protein
VKNITVSLDDETYRRARVKAAALDTSVSSLVWQFLIDLAAGESETERLRRQEHALRAEVVDFQGGARLSRERMHDRDA